MRTILCQQVQTLGLLLIHYDKWQYALFIKYFAYFLVTSANALVNRVVLLSNKHSPSFLLHLYLKMMTNPILLIDFSYVFRNHQPSF